MKPAFGLEQMKAICDVLELKFVRRLRITFDVKMATLVEVEMFAQEEQVTSVADILCEHELPEPQITVVERTHEDPCNAPGC